MTVQHAVAALETEGYETPAQKALLVEIAYRADRHGVVRRSQSEVATACGVSRATAARYFAEFTDSGILDRDGHGRYRLARDAFKDTEDGPFSNVLRRFK